MRVLPGRVLVRSAVVAAAACAVAVPAYAASAGPTGVVQSASVSSSSSCGSSFTLGTKFHASTRSRPLVHVRAGKHTCYDRLTLEFRGPVNGYTIRYVKHVYQEGAGKPMPLAGRAALQVTVRASAYDSSGNPTYTPADLARVVDVSGFPSFRQVAWAGSFEGYTTLGVGVRRGLPFRVLVLPGPGRHTRIVVDVAHDR